MDERATTNVSPEFIWNLLAQHGIVLEYSLLQIRLGNFAIAIGLSPLSLIIAVLYSLPPAVGNSVRNQVLATRSVGE